MIQVGVGTSAIVAAQEAAKAAVVEAKSKLSDHEANLALVFASSTYDQVTVLSTVKEELGQNVVVLGGSTAGEISTAGPSSAPSIVVMLIASDTITANSACVENADIDPETKGQELAEALQKSGVPPSLVLMVADGLKVNPSAILRGLEKVITVPVVGGSAGDDGKYKDTYQYSSHGVVTKAVTAVGLSGNFSFAVGVRHGWNPISGPKKITKANGTVIHEIDGQPAIKLYEEFVGQEQAETLKEKTLAELALSYPLGVKDSISGEMLLRAPFYVDATGSITCGGEVLEGSEVQLMMGSKEAAIEAAKKSATEALQALGTKPVAAVIFNCHVRNTLFASRDEAKKEITAIQTVIGHEVPLAGFYTYAEQAPIDYTNVNIKSCHSKTHNETIVILLLGE